MIRQLLWLCTLLLLTAPVMADQPATVAGFSPQEAFRLGERMYRQGLLPSGEPMQALVQLDILIEGTMFTCDDCHLRSGLGTVEGTIITLPTNGAKLYRTLHVGGEVETRPARTQLSKPFQGGDIRPAYTDKTLAEALWNGSDPNGREFDWTMPRYLLDEREMDIMVYYLKNLSAEYSPGVTATEIRFATVVAENVPQEDRQAMLLTLQAVVKDRNAQSRHQESRARKGPFYRQDRYTAYRRTVLEVWELKGPRTTWRDQLEAYYQKAPVFALLGGIVDGDWSPVHEFCEELKLPAVFPITDFPVVAKDDWQTLYFSKGRYQEGEAAARYLAGEKLSAEKTVVQVFREDPGGEMPAEGFRRTWKLRGLAPPVDRTISSEQVPDENYWNELIKEYPRAIIVLWLNADDLRSVSHLVNQSGGASKLFVSFSLLGEELSALPESIRDVLYVTYPYRLPGEKSIFETTTRSWLKIRDIPVTNIQIQSKMYFLGWVLAGATRNMGDDFYRDYFLDVFDMMRDQHYAIAAYPRLSFGPGQRYASKGCFVVQLSKGPVPELVPVGEWVIH